MLQKALLRQEGELRASRCGGFQPKPVFRLAVRQRGLGPDQLLLMERVHEVGTIGPNLCRELQRKVEGGRFQHLGATPP